MTASRAAQLAVMREGLDRYRERRRLEAIRRVREYEAWVKRHGPLAAIPAIPSKNDYTLARQAEDTQR